MSHGFVNALTIGRSEAVASIGACTFAEIHISTRNAVQQFTYYIALTMKFIFASGMSY